MEMKQKEQEINKRKKRLLWKEKSLKQISRRQLRNKGHSK